MKRLIYLFLIFFAFPIYSQQIILLSDEHGIINNADTITVFLENTHSVEKHVYVTNNSSNSINIRVKKEELILLSGAFNTFCWGQCWAPHVSISPIAIIIEAGQTNYNDFYADYNPNGNNGITLNKYTFFNEADTFVNSYIYIRFISTSANLPESMPDKVYISAPIPNPASQWCRFVTNIPSKYKNASLKIIDLTGTVVLEVPIEIGSSSTRIQIDHLNSGIYFYSLFINNQPQVTRKLIIQK